MGGITDIVREEVAWYAGNGEGAGLRLYPLLDDLHQNYSVTAVDDPNPELLSPEIVILARVVGETVIIEEDRTDKPLVDKLVARGIPREQIILVYAGEPLPVE